MSENVLREIAGRLNSANWTQGALEDEDGRRMCAVGHLRAAWGLSLVDGSEISEDSAPEGYVRARQLLSAAAVDKFPDRARGLVDDDNMWGIMRLNDSDETVVADVREVFHLAAARWDVEAG